MSFYNEAIKRKELNTVVFYSTKSNEKVFHLPHCNIARRIRKEYKMKLDDPEIARALGYRQCNCCSLVGMRLRKEQKAIDQFCQENGVAYHLEDGQLHVRTPYSKWRIIVSGKANKLFLYHRNTFKKDEKFVSIIPGYHSQAIRCKSILEYLNYIVQHDAFRLREKEKAKRKATSHRDLRRNTRPYQRGTSNQSFNAGQLYSILDHLDL